MAALNLVTGYQGVNHVTAPQWADLNRGIIGDAAILPVGSEMQPVIQTANQITVPDGVVVYDGREFYIGYGESVNLAIASGTQGMLRNDIVVVEYNRDESYGVESAQFQVIEGTPVASNPQDPAYSDQDIRTGVFTSQKPFCRVVINGTAIQEIQMLVDVSDNIEKLMQMITDLQEENSELNSALRRGTETFNNITIDETPYSGECTCYTFTIQSAGMQFARIFTTDNGDLWGGYVDGGKLIYRHQSSAGIWLPWQTM